MSVVANLVECSVGVLGRALPSADSGTSDVLQGAIKAVEDTVELTKAATEKASSALVTLHEGVFPEKEVPKELEELAGSFDAEGDFLADFARDNTVHGLESTLVVLLGHGVSCDFDRMVSSVPAVTAANVRRAGDLARRLQETLEKRDQDPGDSSP